MGNGCYTKIGIYSDIAYKGMQLLPIFFCILWRGKY